jgi:uncharacterized protein (TIGR02145 family)
MVFTFISCANSDDDGGGNSSGSNNGGDGFSSSSDGSNNGGGGSCDIKDYRTVTIGDQTWMAENLNCNLSGSKCFNNTAYYCNKYGRLYDRETARVACPSGWHLPSDGEWEMLMYYVENDKGCSSCAAKYLKATSSWNSGGNGTDDYGFSALPGGNGSSNGYYDDGRSGYWWSSGEIFTRNMYYDYWFLGYGRYGDLNSVRCLQD